MFCWASAPAPSDVCRKVTCRTRSAPEPIQSRIASGRLATVKGYALTADDRLRAEIIERIMCDFGADLGQICARHGSAAEAMLKSSPRLRDLISDGIVELDGPSLVVPDESRFLLRSVAAAFDAHLDGSKQLHSRAV